MLISELIDMTEWLDEQEILSDIALDYRIKSLDSIIMIVIIQTIKQGKYSMIYLISEVFVIIMSN